MQYFEDSASSSKMVSKPKSKTGTRFPNEFPSYVVAFSLKETYDDFLTAQQMICNNRHSHEPSPQESTNSMTHSNITGIDEDEQVDNSNDTLPTKESVNKDSPSELMTNGVIDQKSVENYNVFDEKVNKLDQSLRKIDLAIEEHTDKNNPQESSHSMIQRDSLKFLLIDDDTSDASLITIGENKIVFDLSVTETRNKQADNSTIDNDNQEKYEIAQKHSENGFTNNNNSVVLTYDSELDNLLDTHPETDKINEPETIFQSTNINRKFKKRRNSKCGLKNTVNITQKDFKSKNLHHKLNTRLHRYHKSRKCIVAEQIQRELYSNEVSTVVSRTRVLRKIKAKENLLDESKFISFINDVGLNEFENDSLSSSTAKKSIVSNSSQLTLEHKSSTNSCVNSNVVNVTAIKTTDKTSTENVPYKTDVINVAVAVAYDRSKANAKNETVLIPSKEKFMYSDSLTSLEFATPIISNLTSEPPSAFDNFKTVVSVDTLVNKKSSYDISSEDFAMARTSSDFTKSSVDSTLTLKNKEETVIDLGVINLDTRPTILETVIDLGVLQEMTASTSLNIPNEYERNVIVTNNVNAKYPIFSSKDDNEEYNLSNNILKKSANRQSIKPNSRSINLPNTTEINALLKDNTTPGMKCADETRHPSLLPEIWDRLVTTLDQAVKRLEDSLAEKIIKELKKSLSVVCPPIPKDISLSEKNINVNEDATRKDTDECLQCDLVQNRVIDQIMLKLSTDGPRIIEPYMGVKTLQKIKSKLSREFEVLKPPDDSVIVSEKGDTATLSIASYGNEVCKFRRLKILFQGPVRFVRENVLVITSVPTFFVVLLCLYGCILLLIKAF